MTARVIHGLGVAGLLGLSVGGYVAGTPLVTGLLPVSPIIAGAAVTALLIAVRPPAEGIPVTRLWIPVLFAASMAGGWVYATGSEYAADKGLHMATLVPLSLVGGMVVLRHARARAWWVGATIAYAVLVSALILTAPDAIAAESARLSLEGGNTIAAGRAPGAAVAALLALGAAGAPGRLRLLLGAGVLSGLMLANGSRGPLLAVLIAFAFVLLLGSSRAGGGRGGRSAGLVSRWLWIGAVLGVGGAAYAAVAAAGFFVERVGSVADDSVLVRAALYETAWREIGRHPFGGGWGFLEATNDGGHLAGYTYPHNILLEVVVEAGWAGLAGLVGVLVVCWRTQRSRCADPVELAMLALLLFFFISALVSGDLPSHRGLWVMVGACATAPVLPRPATARRGRSGPLTGGCAGRPARSGRRRTPGRGTSPASR